MRQGMTGGNPSYPYEECLSHSTQQSNGLHRTPIIPTRACFCKTEGGDGDCVTL